MYPRCFGPSELARLGLSLRLRLKSCSDKGLGLRYCV